MLYYVLPTDSYGTCCNYVLLLTAMTHVFVFSVLTAMAHVVFMFSLSTGMAHVIFMFSLLTSHIFGSYCKRVIPTDSSAHVVN